MRKLYNNIEFAEFKRQCSLPFHKFIKEVKSCGNCTHWIACSPITINETDKTSRRCRPCEFDNNFKGYCFFCEKWQPSAEAFTDNLIAGAWNRIE